MFPKLTNKKIILALLMLILVSTPFVHAVVLESGIPNTDLKPGTDIKDLSIAQYINYLYLFVLGVVGIAVFASLVFWGVVWISSGIADKRSMALGKIKDAFTGLAIAFGAYIILNTINPDLLTLKEPETKEVTILSSTMPSKLCKDLASNLIPCSSGELSCESRVYSQEGVTHIIYCKVGEEPHYIPLTECSNKNKQDCKDKTGFNGLKGGCIIENNKPKCI